MFALGAIGAGLNLFGGLAQAGQIRRATELRLEQMRRQQMQASGESLARAAASGVETTSGTVQDHLKAISEEWTRRMASVQEAGQDAAGNSILAGASGAFGGFAKALGTASSELDASGDAWKAFGEDQAQKKLELLAPRPKQNPISGPWNWGG